MIHRRITGHPAPGLQVRPRNVSGQGWFIPAMLPAEPGWNVAENCTEPCPAGLAADLHEDADNYYILVEVPGIKKQDLALELKDRMLTVSGQRFMKRGEGEAGQRCSRTFALPDSLAMDSIAAELEAGMLTIKLPKTERLKTRIIPVT